MNYIIIGNSAAGLFAAEEIRRHDTESEIIILTKEEEPSYSRCLTTYFLAGDIPLSCLYLREDDFARRLKLIVVYGVNIHKINPAGQRVQSRDGREWEYGKLLLAMGASARRPAVQGGSLPEVYTLRTLQDALSINEVLERGAQRAVVIGGGLVSLKSACALKKRGLDITVIVSSPQILSQMLNAKAAGLLQKHLAENGLKFLLNTGSEAITGEKHVQGVLLPSGAVLPADLVIIGKGVSPNVEDLKQTGFKINRGLQVDSHLSTNFTHIFAAGDIAETWDPVRQEYTVNATWPNAAAQGRIAGANMCGQGKHYPGSLSLNSVDFFGLSVISVGMAGIPDTKEPGAWSLEESFRMTGGKPDYRCLVWQGTVLKGFILMGDTSQAGILTALLKIGRPFSQAEKALAMQKRGSLAVEQILNRKTGNNFTEMH